LPGAATFVAALAVARAGLPIGFALTVAFAVVLILVELGLLLRAAHRTPLAAGDRRCAGLSAADRAVVPFVFAFSVALAVALTPAAAWLSDDLGQRGGLATDLATDRQKRPPR
jgi:hypothetical protein